MFARLNQGPHRISGGFVEHGAALSELRLNNNVHLAQLFFIRIRFGVKFAPWHDSEIREEDTCFKAASQVDGKIPPRRQPISLWSAHLLGCRIARLVGHATSDTQGRAISAVAVSAFFSLAVSAFSTLLL